MKTNAVGSRLMIGLFSVLIATVVLASDWQYYESKPYGFSMLIPTGTKVQTKEWGGGWGGISARSEGVQIYGLAKLGPKETDADIEKYALNTIGIPASAWTKVDEGKNSRGWERYYTFKANIGAKLLYGAYGVGRKGNYLLYLETTPSDYMEHKAAYDKWYESIRLD